MSKEEILSEYFLVESEKTDEIKGWKVLGTIEVGGYASSSVSPIFEFKTDGESWLCDFRIKLLGCGLVLASPEYVIDEDELVMEAVEKIWENWGITSELTRISEEQMWKEVIKTNPGIWTVTTPATPSGSQWWNNTITCSDAPSYYASYLPSNYKVTTSGYVTN
jgi:hypothetical protein